MNQGKLEVVKQEMARVNVDILGISELKWTGMGEFNSDDQYIYYCRQESLRRNGVVIMVNKRVQNAVLGCNLKNDRMISVRFQGKPFNITVIQVYAPTSNAEEAEVERFYEDLQDLLPEGPWASLGQPRCSPPSAALAWAVSLLDGAGHSSLRGLQSGWALNNIFKFFSQFNCCLW